MKKNKNAVVNKESRSYILQSVVSKNGSWNSDFNGSPKRYEDQYFASDRALKYSVRNLMEQMGKEVLIKKWIKGIKPGKKFSDSSEIEVMTSKDLKEHIKEKFGNDLASIFWNFEDVRHFGMVYDNLGIHGVVQISQGLDLYGQGLIYTDDLTGRMVFESKSDKNKETRGMATREFLSEAHFLYDITVNPANVRYLRDIDGYEDFAYSEEDYALLLECLEHGPRNVKSTQKTNCYTGFLMQVDMKDENKTLLGDLQGKITISPKDENGKITYDFTDLFSYLANKQASANESIYEQIVIKYEGNDIILEGVDTTVTNVSLIKY